MESYTNDCDGCDASSMTMSPFSDGGQSSLDRVLSCLEHPFRRYLLYYLQEEELCEIEDAAVHIATWIEECEPEEVSDERVEHISLVLFHKHLPKLADLNIIEYDQRSETLRFGDPPESLEEFLELAREEEDLN